MLSKTHLAVCYLGIEKVDREYHHNKNHRDKSPGVSGDTSLYNRCGPRVEKKISKLITNIVMQLFSQVPLPYIVKNCGKFLQPFFFTNLNYASSYKHFFSQIVVTLVSIVKKETRFYVTLVCIVLDI